MNISTSVITCGQITFLVHVTLLKERKINIFQKVFLTFCPYNEGQWGSDSSSDKSKISSEERISTEQRKSYRFWKKWWHYFGWTIHLKCWLLFPSMAIKRHSQHRTCHDLQVHICKKNFTFFHSMISRSLHKQPTPVWPNRVICQWFQATSHSTNSSVFVCVSALLSKITVWIKTNPWLCRYANIAQLTTSILVFCFFFSSASIETPSCTPQPQRIIHRCLLGESSPQHNIWVSCLMHKFSTVSQASILKTLYGGLVSVVIIILNTSFRSNIGLLSFGVQAPNVCALYHRLGNDCATKTAAYLDQDRVEITIFPLMEQNTWEIAECEFQGWLYKM